MPQQDDFWVWLFRDIIKDGTSDPSYYSEGRAQPGEWANAILTAFNVTAPGSPERIALIDRLADDGVIDAPDRNYWYGGTRETIGRDYQNLGNAAEEFFIQTVPAEPTPDAPEPSDVSIIPGEPPPQRIPETRGGRPIPAGMRLVRITNPAGSDAGELFLLIGDVYGVNLAYEIGDRAAVEAQFGGIENFGAFESMTQAQFDALQILTVGTADELGPESLQARFDRDMRAPGFDSPPAWMSADQTAMATVVAAVSEGWSPERSWEPLSEVERWTVRSRGLDVVRSQMGTTSFVDSIAEFVRREGLLRESILSSRGPQADVSQQYVTSLIASGWQPEEIDELLQLEKRVRNNPAVMDNINEIFAFQGIAPLDPDDFVAFLQDQDALSLDPSFTPSDIFESVNDALRLQALITEGIDVDIGFAVGLGTGVSETIGAMEQFSRQAQLTAGFIAANQAELNFAKLGLSREDIIAAVFGEVAGPDGDKDRKPVSEVNRILEQFARERTRKAQGFAGGQSFIDAGGRLRVQGFAAFT